MSKVLRQVRRCRVATHRHAAVHVVHESGAVVRGADGRPLVFETEAAATRFTAAHLCPPAAFSPGRAPIPVSG